MLRRQPIRVLVVAARFLPDVGGTETHISEVTRRLAKRGDLDLTVLTTDRSGPRPARQQLADLPSCAAAPTRERRDYYLAPRIYRQIRRGN